MTVSLIYLLLCLSIYGKIQLNVQGFKVSNSCVCGIEVHRLGKIVGGQEVRPYAYPWMALIFKNGNMHCGGALISSRYVLTAGHCLDRSPKESLKLYLGVHYIREVQDREVLPEEIDSLILHKKYSPQMKSGDIGLIKLKNEIDHNRYHYICLPQKQVHYANEKAAASGWGKIAETGGLSEKLLEVNLTIISTKECQEHPSIGEYIRPSMICTREHERKDACNGDSGGPLMIAKHKDALKYWEEIGIVSFGFGCARPDVPAVYTRVFSYIDWIQDNTQDATYCKHPE